MLLVLGGDYTQKRPENLVLRDESDVVDIGRNVALVIDVFAGRAVDGRVGSSKSTELMLDAKEQALHARNVERIDPSQGRACAGLIIYLFDTLASG